MTDAFVTHGVVMKPEEIKYHAPKADAAIEKLGLKSTSSAAEVGTLPLCIDTTTESSAQMEAVRDNLSENNAITSPFFSFTCKIKSP